MNVSKIFRFIIPPLSVRNNLIIVVIVLSIIVIIPNMKLKCMNCDLLLGLI